MRIQAGQTLEFTSQLTDRWGALVDTTGYTFSARLDTLGPNGLPATYSINMSPIASGVRCIVPPSITAVLSTLSTFAVSAHAPDGKVQPMDSGSIILDGVAL